jgi:hypothetical protein
VRWLVEPNGRGVAAARLIARRGRSRSPYRDKWERNGDGGLCRTRGTLGYVTPTDELACVGARNLAEREDLLEASRSNPSADPGAEAGAEAECHSSAWLGCDLGQAKLRDRHQCEKPSRQEPRNLRQEVRQGLTAPIGVPSGSRRNTTIKQTPIGRQTIDYLDQATIDYRDHSHNPARAACHLRFVVSRPRGRGPGHEVTRGGGGGNPRLQAGQRSESGAQQSGESAEMRRSR